MLGWLFGRGGEVGSERKRGAGLGDVEMPDAYPQPPPPAAQPPGVLPQTDEEEARWHDKSVVMDYLRTYNLCPPLWRLIGRFYRDWDVVGGFLFVLGSIGFCLIPILRNYGHGTDLQLDIALVVSVVLFLLAKVVLEARAVYAMLWQRAHKRPTKMFHAAILTLAVGGILFLLVPIFAIAGVLPRESGVLACVSSFLFLVGSGLFTVDGLLVLRKPIITHIENQYFWGSLLLFFGSVLFVVAGLCETSIGEFLQPDGSLSFRDNTVCNEGMVNWLNGIGGLLFAVGSTCFLVFAFVERHEMHNGPDPRILTRHGKEKPHPYRHESWHLVSSGETMDASEV